MLEKHLLVMEAHTPWRCVSRAPLFPYPRGSLVACSVWRYYNRLGMPITPEAGNFPSAQDIEPRLLGLG